MSLAQKISKALASILVLPIRFYQLCISPLTPPACRFTPTCSQYAIEALRRHGPLKGLWLATTRILRCRPGGGYGYDPVPDEFHFFRPKERQDGQEEPEPNADHN